MARLELLREITDPCSRRGIRYPIQSVLALAEMAALGGMRSYGAIAEWATNKGQGRIEERKIQLSAELDSYLDFPPRAPCLSPGAPHDEARRQLAAH